MKIVNKVEDIVNRTLLPAGSRIYASGNAATPQVMFCQLAADRTIWGDVTLMGVLFLGDVAELFTEAVMPANHPPDHLQQPPYPQARQQGMGQVSAHAPGRHPMQVREYLKPNVAMLTVAGPDNGGNYSLGTTMEGVHGSH
jgi:4-hydroxybutyrate CoA-transferase